MDAFVEDVEDNEEDVEDNEDVDDFITTDCSCDDGYSHVDYFGDQYLDEESEDDQYWRQAMSQGPCPSTNCPRKCLRASSSFAI